MRIPTNGIHLEVERRGEGTPVLLLHGFPDSSALWRHQVPTLNEAGFQTIAPDLRGYGGSDKPEGADNYNLLFLAADVIGLLDALELSRVHLVGHDWGAALAWVVASFAPERVDHLAVLSVGHPAAFASCGLDQRERSWYMLLWQFEGIAEEWVRRDGWQGLRDWSRDHPDLDAIAARFEEPGALTAALNWYRANVPPESYVAPPPELPNVQAPTMGVWSTGDPFLVEQQMEGSADHVDGPWRYERVEGAGHWLTLDAPEVVTRLLLDFLPAGTSG